MAKRIDYDLADVCASCRQQYGDHDNQRRNKCPSPARGRFTPMPKSGPRVSAYLRQLGAERDAGRPASTFPHLERDQLPLPVPPPAATPAPKRRRAAKRKRSLSSDVANVPIETFAIGATGANAVSYQLKLIRCGKARCRTCASGSGHGPYWYASTSVNGRTAITYVGKKLPAELAAVRAAR